MNLPLINGEQFEQITKENKETCIVVFPKKLALYVNSWLL